MFFGSLDVQAHPFCQNRMYPATVASGKEVFLETHVQFGWVMSACFVCLRHSMHLQSACYLAALEVIIKM